MKMRATIVAILLTLTVSIAAADTSIKVIALFSDKALLLINGKQKIVKKGETFEGVLLKSASGRGAVVVVDGVEKKLGLNQSIAGNFKKPERSNLKIYPDSLGMYFVNGKINGQTTKFLVDTGASFVVMSGDKAKKLKIDYRNTGKIGQAQTAASIVTVWQIRLRSVSIGGIKIREVEAMVIPGDQPFEVLLGNSFLRHTKMQQAGSVLEIEKKY